MPSYRFRGNWNIAKSNKSATVGRAPWQIYNPHPISLNSPLIGQTKSGKEWVQVAAIDPALRNCAVRIERRTYDKCGDFPTCDPKSIETIVQTCFDFLPSSGASLNFHQECVMSQAYESAIKMIASLASHFAACQYILIESQLPINYEMTRMGQHLISILMFTLRECGSRPLIVEIDAKFKSSSNFFPDAPGRVKKPELKKWAAAKGIEILRQNGDAAVADFVASERKRDDHGDVICYTTAWFQMLKQGGLHHSPPMPNTLMKPKVGDPEP